MPTPIRPAPPAAPRTAGDSKPLAFFVAAPGKPLLRFATLKEAKASVDADRAYAVKNKLPFDPPRVYASNALPQGVKLPDVKGAPQIYVADGIALQLTKAGRVPDNKRFFDVVTGAEVKSVSATVKSEVKDILSNGRFKLDGFFNNLLHRGGGEGASMLEPGMPTYSPAAVNTGKPAIEYRDVTRPAGGER